MLEGYCRRREGRVSQSAYCLISGLSLNRLLPLGTTEIYYSTGWPSATVQVCTLARSLLRSAVLPSLADAFCAMTVSLNVGCRSS
jgi:hypothetical protein